jgi:restriction system protein
MIISALSNLGYSIKRNIRYTNDGGIDGRAVINGKKTYIQAKRYGKHITASHVTEFSLLCKKSGKKGLIYSHRENR